MFYKKTLLNAWQKRIATGFVLLASVLCCESLVAQTAAQIAQFKSLSPEQQQALAAQYGIDINSIGGSSAAAQPQLTASQPTTAAPVPTVEAEEVQSPHEADGEYQRRSKPFGYDLFRQSADSFMPAVDVPVPADYVMGPGDTLVVQLYGKENASYSLVINREGQVQFPEIGPMSLAGLKFSRAQQFINETVAEQMIGVKSSVTMGALRSIRVFVLGEVSLPGSYTVSSLSTMTNALFASGGVAGIGSLRNIQLKRTGELITTLDLYDLLLKGDTSKDERLLPGDVIFIPPVGTVAAIEGQVKRPAIYELKNEKTAAELVALAGGYMPTAYPAASRVERIDNDGSRTVLDVNLTSSQGKSLAIKNGDTVIVNQILDRLENIVTLQGHVKRPGNFNWRKGMRASDLIHSVQMLESNPDLNIAAIIRETQPTRKLEVKYFNPEAAITQQGTNQDPQLQPRDKVIIFGYNQNRGDVLSDVVQALENQADKFNKSQVVTIRGNVRNPARYPLTEKQSLKELIDISGGLTEFAYGLEAEITRYRYDDNSQQYIEHVPVELANGSAEQVFLEPGDAVTIKRIPNWSAPETVTIEGEVAFPGVYTLIKGETLSQVLQRAGGLTDYAYAKGAVFSRVELRELEAERLRDLQARLEADIAASSLEQQDPKLTTSISDTNKLLESIKAVNPRGRMVINLPEIVDGQENADVTLQEGDSIIIPRKKQAITVVGEVQFPTSHLFEQALDVQDYIERSGGLNEKADRSRIYVVKANGRVFLPETGGWFKRGGVTIEAGDTVVVPLDAERIESLTLWTSVSQIVYQIALGAAAINSF